MDKQIFVERDTYVKNEKTYFSYFIKGKVRGKDVRAVSYTHLTLPTNSLV